MEYFHTIFTMEGNQNHDDIFEVAKNRIDNNM